MEQGLRFFSLHCLLYKLPSSFLVHRIHRGALWSRIPIWTRTRHHQFDTWTQRYTSANSGLDVPGLRFFSLHCLLYKLPSSFLVHRIHRGALWSRIPIWTRTRHHQFDTWTQRYTSANSGLDVPGTFTDSDLCAPRDPSRDPQDYRNVILITEDAARDAVRKLVSSSCCCCRPRAEEPVIERVTQTPLFRYRLETFTETRHIEKTCKPYTGQRIEASDREPPPQLWDIDVGTPKMFHEGSKKFPLPRSGEIKTCHKCGGRGRCKCSRCGGSGQFRCRCSSCNRQKSRNKRCPACSGSGRRRCSKCSGRGRRICISCKGEGRLLYYQELAVNWKTLRSEVVSDPAEQEPCVPLILLQKVTGEVLTMENDVTVQPLTGFADVSERLIQDHRNTCGSSCHIMRQRQTVEMIPAAHVQYGYSGKNLSCHVYGRERRVYTQRRLQNLTCGCSIM